MSFGEGEVAEVGEGGDSSIGCKGLEEDIDLVIGEKMWQEIILLACSGSE